MANSLLLNTHEHLRKIKCDVMQLAKHLGATVTVNRDKPLCVGVEAPLYRTWLASPGLHELIGYQWDDEPAWQVWTDLWERMDFGTEPCIHLVNANSCEWCN